MIYTEIVKTKTELYSIVVGDERIPLHSLYDPMKEAKRIVDKLLTDTSAFLVIGSGLMYVPQEILNRMKTPVYVLELIAEIRELVKNRKEYKDAILRGIIPLNDIDKSLISDVRVTPVILPNYLKIIRKYRPAYFEIINNINEQIKAWISYKDIFVNNLDLNSKFINGSPGVVKLKTIGRDKPVAVLGAGPSLIESLPILKKYNNKLIIISSGTALKSCISMGIIPDFFCIIDPKKETIKQIEGVDISIPLVFSPGVNHNILRMHKGDKFIAFIEDDLYTQKNNELVNLKGALKSFGSVIHFCFSLASYISSGDIFLAGVDFEEDILSHSKGTYHYEEILRASSKFSFLNFKKTDTDYKYLSFKKSLENLISRTKNKVYRINPSKIYLQGAEEIRLNEFEILCSLFCNSDSRP
ncbi:MAG: 6-hydroxymethylpterin diphosphokinase MptE-like protein [Candidatus Hydrogenedentota bacterium]